MHLSMQEPGKNKKSKWQGWPCWEIRQVGRGRLLKCLIQQTAWLRLQDRIKHSRERERERERERAPARPPSGHIDH